MHDIFRKQPLRVTRSFGLIWLLLFSLITVDIALHQGEGFSGYSTRELALLALFAAGALAGLGLSLWLFTGEADRRQHVVVKAAAFVSRPVRNRLLLALMVLLLILLWQVETPLWRQSLRLVSLLVLTAMTFVVLVADLPGDRLSDALRANRQRLTIVAGIIIAVFLVLDAYLVRSIEDEGAQIYTQVQLTFGNYTPYVPGSLQTLYAPLAYYIHGFFMLLFGPSLLVARLVSAGAGAIAVILLYDLTRREAGEWAGLAALLIILLSPSMLRSFSTAFGYALVAAFLLAALWVIRAAPPSWWRTALALTLAGLAVFVRHSVILSPIIIGAYFVLTERPRVWLPGALVAVIVAVLLTAPFWPEILILGRAIPGVSLLLPPLPLDVLIENSGGYNRVTLSRLLYYLNILVGSHAVPTVLGFLAAFFVVRHLRSAGDWRRQLSNHRILVLAAALFAGNWLIHYYVSIFVCSGCIALYVDYFALILIFIVAAVLTRTWFRDGFPRSKSVYLVGWALLAALTIVTGRRAIAVWHYSLPPASSEVNAIAARLQTLTRPGDHVFYLGPFHPLIPLVDRRVYPELDYYYMNYLQPQYDLSPEDMAALHFFNDGMVSDWLNEDAQVAVITGLGYESMARNATLKATIDTALAEHFSLVEVIPPPASIPGGELRIYRRNPPGQ